MSLPGVSRHLRMTEVCCRTATKASSNRRAWSSGGAGVAMMQLGLPVRSSDSDDVELQRGSSGYVETAAIGLAPLIEGRKLG